jgi:hypothetical protein
MIRKSLHPCGIDSNVHSQFFLLFSALCSLNRSGPSGHLREHHLDPLSQLHQTDTVGGGRSGWYNGSPGKLHVFHRVEKKPYKDPGTLLPQEHVF